MTEQQILLISDTIVLDNGIVLTKAIEGGEFVNVHGAIFKKCEDCGEWFAKDDMWYVDGYGWVCQDCIDVGDYAYCEKCNTYHNHDDMVEVWQDRWSHNSQYMCIGCAEDVATKCACCGRWHMEGIIYVDSGWAYRGQHICPECAEDEGIYCCYSCGCYGDDVRYSEYHDADYCEDCMPDNGVIQEYGKTDSLPFIGEDNELHMGVELEIDDGGFDGNNAEELLDILDVRYAEAKADGSISDGFELVSSPATLEAHLTMINWEKAMDRAIDMGYRSHNPGTCGLHIHIDRDYLSPLLKEDYEERFAMLFANNVEWIKKFSRRNSYSYCEITNEMVIKTTPREAKTIGSKAKPVKCGRYLAINYQTGLDTIEFRIFRGTLRYNTFVATLQFVQMFCDYVKYMGMEELASITLGNFYFTAKKKGYNEFITYLGERGLI